jgi:ubiquinone biosynthesis protein
LPPEERRRPSRRSRARSWLRRGLQVSGILWRHGFGPLMRAMGLGRFLPSSPDRELDPETTSLDLPVRVRMACEEIGPVTIKLAQALASRQDLVPLEYARELRRLQDHVPPFDSARAREIVEAELKAPVGELFAQFDETPAASASIGQVHMAVLPDGQRAAVKVQRPELAQVVDTDLQILAFAAREAERHLPAVREYRVTEWTAEFARSLRAELDYTNEGQNTDRLRQVLAGDERVVVPRVHWSLSTRRVLTLERMSGVALDDVEGLDGLGISRTTVATHLAESVLRQIFIKGFFHADPHAGNLFVQRDGRIVFLDCGNAASIGRDQREAMVRLLQGILDEDAAEVCDQILDIGSASEATDLQQLRLDISRILGRYSGVRTSEVGLADALEQMMGVIFRHRVRMPSIFPSVLRAMMLTDGNCRLLDPKFDFRGPAREISREVLREWVKPQNLGRELWHSLRDIQRFGMLVPRQLSEVLAKAQAGGLKVKLEAEHIEEPLRRLDVMFNRLAFALVVASMIVGSSVILASDRAVGLLSTPGAVAYGLIGALMGLYLLYSILISGRL